MLNRSEALDRAYHALADPARRAMLDRLSRGPMSVSELAQPFDMSLPAVMQHLQVLENSGLVRSQKKGRVRTCHIETRALRIAEDWIVRRRSQWETRFDRLEALLAAQDQEIERKTRRSR